MRGRHFVWLLAFVLLCFSIFIFGCKKNVGTAAAPVTQESVEKKVEEVGNRGVFHRGYAKGGGR